MDDVPKGRPLAIDATARSAPTEPAFIAHPDGAPSTMASSFSTTLMSMVSRLARLPIGKRSPVKPEMRS
jgi:hypothetical protein